MELRLTIFLLFTSVAIFTNTLLIWLAYKRFATAASAVLETLIEVETSGGVRTWLRSINTAAEDAVNITENIKRQMADGEAYLVRAQEKYVLALVNVDSQLEKATDEISAGARKMSDAVAKPASSILRFSARLSQLLGPFKNFLS